MASAFSHAIVATAVGQAAPARWRGEWRFWYLAILCSILPDIDVIGFRFGIHYGDLWGHRGLTHSLLFALGVGLWAACRFRSRALTRAQRLGLAAFFIIVTASHGILDAMTNGGLGVAFFSPFSPRRYFFPWRPIQVSPIGVSTFFTEDGLQVLRSEIQWIWIPSLLLFLALRYAVPRALRRRSA
jgi:inner membrane protein